MAVLSGMLIIVGLNTMPENIVVNQGV